MIIRKKVFVSLLAAMMLISTLSVNGFAAEDVPVIDDTKDFSNLGEPTYSYEGDFVIRSYQATPEEIKLGEDLQKWHVHPQGSPRHFNLTSHVHSIRNIQEGTAKKCVWWPTQNWTRNSKYPDAADWPTVSWETSQSVTAAKSVNTSVGVTDDVVTVSLGVDYTKEHTFSTSITQTFKVPYHKDGRVKVSYSRPCKTFTCVTKYGYAGPPPMEWEETGAGSALGKPMNIVCDLETRSYQR